MIGNNSAAGEYGGQRDGDLLTVSGTIFSAFLTFTRVDQHPLALSKLTHASPRQGQPSAAHTTIIVHYRRRRRR